MSNSLPNKVQSKTLPQQMIIVNHCRISILKDRLFRVEYGLQFVDEPTQSIWYRNFGSVPFAFQINEKFVIINLNGIRLVIHSENFSKSYIEINGKKEKLNNAQNLKGTTRTLDMTKENKIIYDDYMTNQKRHVALTDSKLLDDGVCSKNGVAIYDDANSLLLMEDQTVIENPLIHDYYIFAYGHKYADAVSALYDLCGKVPLLPKYVFGNWWSRYWAYSDQEYLQLMKKFSEKGIVLSVATIDMDWHYVELIDEFKLKEKGLMDPEIYGQTYGWTGYSWNKHLFPCYQDFLMQLHDMNLKVTLNLHPADGIRWFEDCYEVFAEKMGIDAKSKRYIPFDFTSRKFIQAYLEMLHEYEKDGVDFWWIDWQQGNTSKIKGYDPLWALNHFLYQDHNQSNHRGLILSRYCGVGAHRYPLGFSGDTTQEWKVLRYVIYFTATASNIGYTFWSHDIGGHHDGFKDDELYVRWLQFALYNPILRLHSATGELYGKEPWNYNFEAESLAIEILRQRMKLIPYIYHLACQNHYANKPLIEPLYYRDPESEEAYTYKEEYFFGDLLVAPITRRINKSSKLAYKDIYFPEGKWVDIQKGIVYSGPKKIRIYRKINETPAFLPQGGVIIENSQVTNRMENPKYLTIHLYKGNRAMTFFEDDGETIDRSCAKTIIRQTIKDKMHTIFIETTGDLSVLPSERTYQIELHQEKIEKVFCPNDELIYEYENDPYGKITVFNVPVGKKIEISMIEKDISTVEQIKIHLKEILLYVNGNNEYRHGIFDQINAAADDEQMIQIIEKSNFHEDIKAHMLEVIDAQK